MPTTIWDTPYSYIPDSDIADLSIPGVDPAPISGVVCQPQGSDGLGTWSIYVPAASTQVSAHMSVAYISSGVPSGRILSAALPAWITGYNQQVQAAVLAEQGLSAGETAGSVVTAANVSITDYQIDSTAGAALVASFDDVKQLCQLFAQDKFLRSFRLGTEITITARLLLKGRDGKKSQSNEYTKAIIPGTVCAIGDSAGKTFTSFYVTSVRHSISFNTSTANTYISGKYVRPAEGFPMVVAPGTGSPMYKTGI
jgi:hypothetical protein